ncbi:carbon-nitrogen hydrolase [Flagelloscypha sp. PMI_526]|nr:carbon-nitrogen hydrolase [Flagelloscypha sp. PMI_526]
MARRPWTNLAFTSTILSLLRSRLLHLIPVMGSLKVPLRIGVVQMDPKIGEVSANIVKAEKLCKGIQPDSLDILCFPEMFLSGYVFRDAQHISEYLEAPYTGLSSVFCRDLAKRLHCHVLAGYPERATDIDREKLMSDSAHLVGYNSSILYSPQGEPLGTYRKTHLYETDTTWAIPGSGFMKFDLPAPLHTVTLAICMDLNAQVPEWTTTSGPYEVAEHTIASNSRLLLLLNNWLDSEVELEEENDWSTLNFWASRLRPLWTKKGKDGLYSSEPTQDSSPSNILDDETIVVVCNRCGIENGVRFAGSSSLYSMSPSVGRPRLLDVMGRNEEGLRIWNILIQPPLPTTS